MCPTQYCHRSTSLSSILDEVMSQVDRAATQDSSTRRGRGRGFSNFFPCPDSVIAPSDSDPERCDDYVTETESFVGPIRQRRGRGRAKGFRPLCSNMDPPPELEQPNEILKQESPPKFSTSQHIIGHFYYSQISKSTVTINNNF